MIDCNNPPILNDDQWVALHIIKYWRMDLISKWIAIKRNGKRIAWMKVLR